MLNTTELDDFDFDFEDDIVDKKVNEAKSEVNTPIKLQKTQQPQNSIEEEAQRIINETQPNTSESIEQDTQDKKELILYIISDRNNPSMLEYFRGFGIKVSQIFTRLEDARDTLVMQVEPSRVVIMESGNGKFTSMTSRKVLLDLLGICDEDTEIAIFYTDSVIKTEVSDSDIVDAKLIDWFKYKSTVDVAANLLQLSNKEEYIYDTNETKVEKVNTKNILDFKGLTLRNNNEKLELDLGLPAIGVDEIRIHMMENESAEGLIKGYKIKI